MGFPLVSRGVRVPVCAGQGHGYGTGQGEGQGPGRRPLRGLQGEGQGPVRRSLRGPQGEGRGMPLGVAGVLAVLWAASGVAGDVRGPSVAAARAEGGAAAVVEAGSPRKSSARAQKVTLRLHLLRGSTPPTWVPDFTKTQGPRTARVEATPQKQLADGWRVLSEAKAAADAARASGSVDGLGKKARRKLAECPDLVTVGDAWLEAAVRRGLLRPLASAAEVDGFVAPGRGMPPGLSPPKPWLGVPAMSDATTWGPVLRRNAQTGAPDPAGDLYAFPYRVGGLVVAYRADLLKRAGIPPPTSWADVLGEPRLAGRVLFPAGARDVVGVALKSLGASFNAADPEFLRSEAVRRRLADVGRQALVFESDDAGRPLQNGNAWVAVGWSHDMCRVAQRAPGVRVVVPREGTALTADLLCMPSARPATPGDTALPVLADQFLRFASQPARAVEMAASQTGAPPGVLGGAPAQEAQVHGSTAHGSRLMTGSVLPLDLCAGSEFQLPLDPAAHAAYADLVAALAPARTDAGGAGAVAAALRKRLHDMLLSFA